MGYWSIIVWSVPAPLSLSPVGAPIHTLTSLLFIILGQGQYKLADGVLREKYKMDAQPGMPVAIDLSGDDLATLVGTARENIIRILSEFKELGILTTRGRQIIVREVKKLVEIANYK